MSNAQTGLPAAFWPKAVIFDLDGTLVDSAPDVRLAINSAFEPAGAGPFTLDQVRGFIGGGAAKALERAMLALQWDPASVDQRALMSRFMETYLEVSKGGRGLYPGARELLSVLSQHRIKLAICTNKAAPITAAATRALGIDGFFNVIIGAREDLPKKPDPSILQEALSQMNVSAGEAIMVGDSSADVGAAHAAGLPIILMSYGYTPHPHQLGADCVIDELAGFMAAVPSVKHRKMK